MINMFVHSLHGTEHQSASNYLLSNLSVGYFNLNGFGVTIPAINMTLVVKSRSGRIFKTACQVRSGIPILKSSLHSHCVR